MKKKDHVKRKDHEEEKRLCEEKRSRIEKIREITDYRTRVTQVVEQFGSEGLKSATFARFFFSVCLCPVAKQIRTFSQLEDIWVS